MKFIKALLIVTCLVCSSSTAWARPVNSWLVEKTIKIGDLNRTYYVASPSHLSARMPLVLVLHGGGGDGRQVARHTGFARLARKENFIAVFPDAYQRVWNDGRHDNRAASIRRNIDDFAFINTLLNRLEKDYPIDKAKIYVTGPSNGGCMTYALAAKMADRITAAAPVIGGMPEEIGKNFHPQRPISLLVIQSVNDPIMPYGGGNIRIFNKNRGRIIPTEKALELWRNTNGLKGRAVVETLPNKAPSDGCITTRSTWTGGKNSSELVFYSVKGGGHGWPGSSGHLLPTKTIGNITQDFSATEAIWSFFKAH